MIQAALSRQREFLADAFAVQFTRNPDGIAGALKTIGGWTNHTQIQSPEALDTAPLFFGDSIKRISSNSPMATHPPLQQRILRLDPNWDGTYPEPTRIVEAVQESIRHPSKPSRNPMNLRGMPNILGGMFIPPILAGLAEGARGRQNLGQSVGRSLTTAGQPGDEQFGYARSLKLKSLFRDLLRQSRLSRSVHRVLAACRKPGRCGIDSRTVSGGISEIRPADERGTPARSSGSVQTDRTRHQAIIVQPDGLSDH